MKRLPKLNPIEISETRREFCGRWLHCHDIRQLLAEDTEEDVIPLIDTPPASTKLNVKSYAEGPLVVGEIRMLAPSLTPESEVPIFVAVVGEWDDGGFMVVPYSRYPVPAFTSEFYTGWKEEELATLCTWNLHTLGEYSLAKSWVVDHLAEQECADAVAHFHHFAFGSPLPARLEERIGAPILYPDDPRIAYQSEEKERCAGLGRLQAQLMEEEELAEFQNLIYFAENFNETPREEEMLLAAAEPGETRQRVYVFEEEDPSPIRSGVAVCDQPFRLEAGGDLPEAQWVLEEAAGDLAHAEALLLHRDSRKVVAFGEVEASGEVINLLQNLLSEGDPGVSETDDLIWLIFI